MGESTETDASVSRRNRALHLAGATLAVANIAAPSALVAAAVRLVPDTGLGLFKNGNSLGWFVTFMFLFALLHLIATVGYIFVRLLTPSKYRRGGAVTLALACSPWVEWVLFYIYMRSEGY
jgi:hypothetical protein